jgi:hypothetical protein
VSRHPLFDRSALEILPLAERTHDLGLDSVLDLVPTAPELVPPALDEVGRRIVRATRRGAATILMMGAHVLRSGVQRYLIDLMRRKLLSCIAVNGAVPIHDFELALAGATTESVARYIVDGRFGLWRETGRINDIVNQAHAADPSIGLGEALGQALLDGDYPHKDISLLAAAARHGVPLTVHVGIGMDIIHEHPNFDAAAAATLSYADFLIFTQAVTGLKDGVLLNFGSAVMAPEVFLKALSMARNAARRSGREINGFTTLVCDLRQLPADHSCEPAKGSAEYYFRPWKTMLVRTVQDGGESFYLARPHAETVPALWTAVMRALEQD